MIPTRTVEEKRGRQVRLWPGIAAVALQWLLWFVVPAVVPGALMIGFLGGLAGGLAVLVWWAFFSRTPHAERWGAIVLIAAAIAATRQFLDPSVANLGMGRLFYIHAIPAVSLGLVGGALMGRRLTAGRRRAALAAGVLLACGAFLLLRTDGITGDGASQFAWRWSKTHEQELLARSALEPPPPPAATTNGAPGEPSVAPAPAAIPTPAPKSAEAPAARRAPARSPADWPGFRGPLRDGRVTGLRIRTDWASSPPFELWRREVGPGWSSFAAGNGLLYTLEQRGDFEVVACYRVATGEPVWSHRNAARFWESEGGAGPRGTPALSDGRVYALGATGILDALDAATGALLWTRNAASDTGVKIPGWGITSSPLVVNDVVIVAASGRLAAYDLNTGDPRWYGPKVGGSYGSPQSLSIGGVEQVVLLTSTGATSVGPRDGKVLWQHSWPGSTILQPAVTAEGGVLITTGDMAGGSGTRRLAVAHGPGGWTAEEVWTSRGLKPYFNDFVVHGGHAFGFDGSILSCIDLKDGARKWKGGRYGHGQMLLLADQDLLLVLSEEGELALVAASPDQYTELARFAAVEGKTWNHPAVAGDTLLVRNGQEMAAFRLARAGN